MLENVGLRGQRLWLRHAERHRHLVLEPILVELERRFEREDRLTVLDGDDAPRGEGAAVADAVDLVDDRHAGVARPHEIAVERMDVTIRLDGALRGHERLRDRLAAEDALPALLGAATTIQIVFQLLEVENAEKLLNGQCHLRLPQPGPPVADAAESAGASQGGADQKGNEIMAATTNPAAARQTVDVLVAGAGYVGLATAVAIRQARPSLSVTVIDAAPAEFGNATGALRPSPRPPAACSTSSAAGRRSRRKRSRSTT